MTDQEINEAVARKFGIECFDCSRSKEHAPRYCNIPDYCHSIAAAWEIPEKCPFQDDGKIKNGLFFALIRRETTWDAGWCRYDECMMIEASAAMAPMAICLAFLKVA